MQTENRPNAFTTTSNKQYFINLLSASWYVFDIIVKLGLPWVEKCTIYINPSSN